MDVVYLDFKKASDNFPHHKTLENQGTKYWGLSAQVGCELAAIDSVMT